MSRKKREAHQKNQQKADDEKRVCYSRGPRKLFINGGNIYGSSKHRVFGISGFISKETRSMKYDDFNWGSSWSCYMTVSLAI
mmetsp:Transcript_14735/g.21736  ORF Transcript_14735/g.21736 Transcript_14735/m.21736 type:complete len:82 (+) Transcript_14735:703-948(+)